SIILTAIISSGIYVLMTQLPTNTTLFPYTTLFRSDKIMEQGAVERAVCLMDIPDDWNQEYNLELYMETFDAAIAFAKKYPETLRSEERRVGKESRSRWRA